MSSSDLQVTVGGMDIFENKNCLEFTRIDFMIEKWKEFL